MNNKNQSPIAMPMSSLHVPRGATHFLNANFYKIGRFGFVYRYDECREEWRRSYVEKNELRAKYQIELMGDYRA